MSFRASIVSLSLLSLGAAGFAAGCAAPDEDDASLGGEEALTAREGYKKLPPLNGGVFVSVAVAGRTAFLGDNSRTLRAYDLQTQRVTRTLGERLPTDSLSVSGTTLAACGEREVDVPGSGGGIFPASALHFEVNLLDTRTLAKKRTVSLNLEAYLDTTDDMLRDKPDLRCSLDGDKLTVSFSQDKLKHEVVTFPVPAADLTTDFRTIPGATRVTVTPASGTREGTVSGFTQSPAGLTIAAGGWGIRRLAPGARALTTLRGANRETFVDVEARGGALFAAKHEGALLVLDDATGRELASFPIADWVEDLALADGYAVVLGREGILVKKDTWSRAR